MDRTITLSRSLSFLALLLFALGSACGSDYVAPPHPTCFALQRMGQSTPTYFPGAITAKLSPDSPAGRLPRFPGQTVFKAELTAAAGPTCEDVQLDYVGVDIPDALYTKFPAQERPRLYFDVVNADHELLRNGVYSPLTFKPGDSHQFLVVVDSTYLPAGTTATITLPRVTWTTTTTSLSRGLNEVSLAGHPLIFDRTMQGICAPVEDKIAQIGMSMTGWDCGDGLVNFLLYAPKDRSSCQIYVDRLGPTIVTPEKIISAQEFHYTTQDGMNFIRCRHP